MSENKTHAVEPTPPPAPVKELSVQVVDVKKPDDKDSFLVGLLRGIKSSFDEVGFLLTGAVGSKLIQALYQRMKSKGNPQVMVEAGKLMNQGKHKEAGDLMIQSLPFGLGKGDEAGFLASLAWAIQCFEDGVNPQAARDLITALSGLDEQTLVSLRLTLAEIESVEERGKILVKIGREPSQIAEVCRITGLTLDPENHPARVFATQLGSTLEAVTTRSNQRTNKLVTKIEIERRKRARQVEAARRRQI